MRKPPLLDDQHMAQSEPSAPHMESPRCWRCRQRCERAMFRLDGDTERANFWFCNNCNTIYVPGDPDTLIDSSAGRMRENDELITYGWHRRNPEPVTATTASAWEVVDASPPPAMPRDVEEYFFHGLEQRTARNFVSTNASVQGTATNVAMRDLLESQFARAERRAAERLQAEFWPQSRATEIEESDDE